MPFVDQTTGLTSATAEQQEQQPTPPQQEQQQAQGGNPGKANFRVKISWMERRSW